MSTLISLIWFWLKIGCIVSDTELLYYNELSDSPTIDGWDLSQGNHFCDFSMCPLPGTCCWEVQTTGLNTLLFNINVTGYKNIQFMYSVLPHAYSVSFAPDCIFAYNVNGGIWNDFDMYGYSDEDIQYNNVTYNTPVGAWNADNLGFRLSIGNMQTAHCSLYNFYVFGDLINSNNPTMTPTNIPSNNPSQTPTNDPTNTPTHIPSKIPTNNPSVSPTSTPSTTPTMGPSQTPTNDPTNMPSKIPTNNPTITPTNAPTSDTRIPSKTPTNNPSQSPTNNPTNTPTDIPSQIPTDSPTVTPTSTPSTTPSESPTNIPTSTPTRNPTFIDIRPNIDIESSIGICDDLILDATATQIINADKNNAVFTWIFNNDNLDVNVHIGQYIIISNTLLTEVNYLYNISLLIAIESSSSSINFGVYKNDIIKPQLKLQPNQIRNNMLTVFSEIIFDNSCVENRTSIDYVYEWTITDDTNTQELHGNNTISIDLSSFQVGCIINVSLNLLCLSNNIEICSVNETITVLYELDDIVCQITPNYGVPFNGLSVSQINELDMSLDILDGYTFTFDPDINGKTHLNWLWECNLYVYNNKNILNETRNCINILSSNAIGSPLISFNNESFNVGYNYNYELIMNVNDNININRSSCLAINNITFNNITEFGTNIATSNSPTIWSSNTSTNNPTVITANPSMNPTNEPTTSPSDHTTPKPTSIPPKTSKNKPFLVIIILTFSVILAASIAINIYYFVSKRKRKISNAQRTERVFSASIPETTNKTTKTIELQHMYSGSIETIGNNKSGEPEAPPKDSKFSNDLMIAKIMQNNQFDLKNLTKGNIKLSEFNTKKNDANGEIDDDIMEGNQPNNDINNNNEGLTNQS